MEFEFDPEKSDNNKKKHGIDFYEAQGLWDDPGDKKAIDRLCRVLNEADIGEFPILPPHTLTIRIGVGDKLNSNIHKTKDE